MRRRKGQREGEREGGREREREGRSVMRLTLSPLGALEDVLIVAGEAVVRAVVE